MNKCMRILSTLTLAALCGPVLANPTLKSVTPTFYQGGNGILNVGLIVQASSSLPVLIIAGGFTITCTTSSLPQTAERRTTIVDFFGPKGSLRIPEVVPSTYSIPGWSSIPAGTCSGQCIMQYKGEARDETSLSIRVGNAGVGASFTLIPAGEQSKGDSVHTNVCRSGTPQCCTPGCSIQ